MITVETAYQMLKDEGYIESRERSGYFVTELIPMGKVKKEQRTLQLLEESEQDMDELDPNGYGFFQRLPL